MRINPDTTVLAQGLKRAMPVKNDEKFADLMAMLDQIEAAPQHKNYPEPA